MGFPGSDTSFFIGVSGPRALPERIRSRLERAFIESVRTGEVAGRLSLDGFRPLGGSGADLERLIRREIKLWEKVVSDANITLK
jgi:tripartite-type tricarboxylate transporter receptor subunit TctC